MKNRTKQLSEKRQRPSRFSLRWQLLPGFAVIGLLLLARSIGLFQGLELKTLDSFLRLRPAESRDERILIVGIDEADIQKTGTYPIPDGTLAELLKTLSKENPRAIGLDIIRDLPVEPGHEEFKESLDMLPNIIGIERISTDRVSPHTLPPEQVGLIDFPLDRDGYLRRTYLGANPPENHPDGDRFRFSFALLMAQAYLAEEDIFLDSGRRNPDNMRFGDSELFSLQPNSGGYVRAKPGGVQILINVRSGPSPFKVVSMTDVLEGRVDKAFIKNRVVLIGVTSLTVKDTINARSVNSTNPGLVTGVEMHAHITSQLLSAVLDNRPMILVWPDLWEYLWIILAGGVGMVLLRLMSRPVWYVLAVGLAVFGLVGMGILMLCIGGLWVPVVPILVIFTLNAAGILPAFYAYGRTLRARIDERQRIIEQTYDAIHSGPLQNLALLLQRKENFDLQSRTQLESLNRELRQIYDRLLKESLSKETQLLLGNNHILTLRNPLHEVLYEVYTATLKRDFPGFESIQLKVVRFEALQAVGLTADDKQALCRFLEEALCNVGKHAMGTQKLTVHCLATASENLLLVEDNSPVRTHPEDFNIYSSGMRGRGTQQAATLAQRLHGSFRRIALEPGTRCELRWPLSL